MTIGHWASWALILIGYSVAWALSLLGTGSHGHSVAIHSVAASLTKLNVTVPPPHSHMEHTQKNIHFMLIETKKPCVRYLIVKAFAKWKRFIGLRAFAV